MGLAMCVACHRPHATAAIHAQPVWPNASTSVGNAVAAPDPWGYGKDRRRLSQKLQSDWASSRGRRTVGSARQMASVPPGFAACDRGSPSSHWRWALTLRLPRGPAYCFRRDSRRAAPKDGPISMTVMLISWPGAELEDIDGHIAIPSARARATSNASHSASPPSTYGVPSNRSGAIAS
jgi:hypothetical protein